MSLKGKQAKTVQRAEYLSCDTIVERYLVKGIEFDSAIWYDYEDSVAVEKLFRV